MLFRSLLPGCTVYLEGSANPARKTRYDLVAVEKGRPGLPPLLINMDAQAPNQVFREWMEAGGGQALGLGLRLGLGLLCALLRRADFRYGFQ